MREKIVFPLGSLGLCGLLALLCFWVPVSAQQQADIGINISGGQQPVIAVPDFRGSAEVSPFMGAFNQTLVGDLQQAGIFKIAPKTLYPVQVPQQPQDFRAAPDAAATPRNTGALASAGNTLAAWSGPPVNANYLAFGYTAAQSGRLALYGWLYNVAVPELSGAQVLGKVYLGSLDENGARQVAHEFAADILKLFGGVSLAGTKIYFMSERTGSKEIWSMDYDGGNQKQFTVYRTITTMPAVSPDGSRLAFTSFTRSGPSILVHSLTTGRRLPFYNQAASMNATAEFTPDSRQVLFSSTAGGGGYANLYIANVDGSNLRRLTNTRAIEVEPKVNPKTGSEVVFVSGRSGPPQIYRMNIDGVDVQRLTSGEGEAVNPSWSPDGRFIAFAWTRGYAPGSYNIFVMDVAKRSYVQLTSGAGRNENPTWAPDGRHIVFSSNRGGSSQIWTMLADGTQLKQLTRQGRNEKPVWSKAAQ